MSDYLRQASQFPPVGDAIVAMVRGFDVHEQILRAALTGGIGEQDTCDAATALAILDDEALDPRNDQPPCDGVPGVASGTRRC